MNEVAWFGVLGPLEVTAGGHPVTVPGWRQRELLVVLLLRANQPVPVDVLVDVAWRDQPPATAHRQVQNCVGRLRRALTAGGLAADVIETRPGGYLLRVADGQVDTLAFARHVAAGRRAAAEGLLPEAVGRLREALTLWRGPALADLDGDLVSSEAARLEDQRLAVLEDCLELELRLGRHHEAAGELVTLVRDHPLSEPLWSRLMLALYRDGRKAEALDAFRRACEVFRAELDVEPGNELAKLEQAIRDDDPALSLPADEVEQPTEPDLPRPCQLPPDVADFTGRDETIDELAELLGNGRDGRAVVISAIAGQAGVGKTALAVHVAHRLRAEFPDGQLYVNLRSAQDHRAEPAEVLARFLSALGVAGTAIPDGIEERAALYRERLAERRMLVVLDNAVNGAQVQPLLPGVPGCAVLVTSRSRLALPGTRPVELDVLPPEQAVDLLTRIVGPERVAEELEAARELIRLCGRLPLALRIVGARLAVRPHWTLARMARRLGDEQRRLDELTHEDLEVRASLGLSYHHLAPRSRRLFHLLGLLDAPDFTDWVCAALLDTTIATADDLIDDLVDAQLIDISGRDSTGRVRYHFHDLVRLYARERAVAEEFPAERAAAVARALGGWLAVAEKAHQAVYGGDFVILHGTAARWRTAADALAEPIAADPLSWYDAERLNIVAGVRQAAEAGLDELCWDLAASTVSLFLTRGHNDDWEHTLTMALAATRRGGNRRGTALMLTGLGLLDTYRHRYDNATAVLDEAIQIFQDLGDRHGLALALPLTAHVDGFRGHYDQAVARHEASIEVLRSVGDRGAATLALRSLGQLLNDIGRPGRARPYLEQALEASREDDQRTYAEVLHQLAELYLAVEEVERAEEALDEMIGIVERLEDRRGEAYARHGLGLVRLEQRAHVAAADELRRSLAICLAIGEPLREAEVRIALGELHRRLREPAEALAHLTASVRITTELATPLWRARGLRVLGDVHADQGDDTAARDAWTRARELFAEIGSPEAAQVDDRLMAYD
ncbi:MAG: BTAD domain-containing putative transcriptional regulator [Actinomadura sp.]